jgi:uncharacterized protein YecE (DUF72 family)
MKSARTYIGTSGWHYAHWIGRFYPADTRPGTELGLFSKQFSTVEINNSFYRMPGKPTFEKWKKTTPPGFTFAVKASRYITHMKKLKDGAKAVRQFLGRADALGRKLGPVLFQLPPHWHLNLDRLTEFLRSLPKGYRYAFEFRDHTWYTNDVLTALKKYSCAFCIYELDGHMSPEEITANFVYVRLHGPGGKYQGSYPDKVLKTWAAKIQHWNESRKDVYIYFDNDDQGFAAFNARRLASLLKS